MNISSRHYPSFCNTTNFTQTSPAHCLCSPDVREPASPCARDDDVMANTDTSTVPFYPWDNPHSLISRDTLIILEEAVTCGLNPLLLAVGLPSNVLNCLVFQRQGLGDRMNVSLFSLALVDLFCVVFWFLLGSFCLVGHALPSTPYIMGWWKWTVRKYIRGFHRGFLFSSGCLTMLIAVERCLCVAMPLKAANLVRTRTMTTFIVAIVLSLHLLCIIYPFKFDVVITVDEETGKMMVTLPSTPYYLNYKALIDALDNHVIMTVIPFVTFVVVTVATAITIVRLRRVMTWRRKSASTCRRSSQVGLVKMLVIVSCIYIVTISPNIVMGIIRSLNSDFWLTGKYQNTFVATHLLYLALGTVNSTVNFFVYVSRSSRFRAELFRILPCCLRLWPSARRQHADVNGMTSAQSKAVSVITNSCFSSSHFTVESSKEISLTGQK